MTSNLIASTLRKNMMTVIASLFAMVLVAGCSTTEITKGQILGKEKLPRPETVWVYDFVTSPADVQDDASLADKTSEPSNPLTPEEIHLNVQVGKNLATDLVKQINAMGLNSIQVTSLSKFQVNDIVLRGYLYSVVTGNAAKRIFLGFGYGASDLHTIVEGYQMTDSGLHKLSSADLNAAGGHMPGGGAMGVITFIVLRNPVGLILAPAVKGVQELAGGPTIEGRVNDTATKIADALKVRFQKEDWISQ